ncbi:hypothetical protein HOP50_01g08680 [Chloropicon primus]|nr:hypothetical protein HOP50_01g08680 [Chloropicon primus]
MASTGCQRPLADRVDSFLGRPPRWVEELSKLQDDSKMSRSVAKILQHRRKDVMKELASFRRAAHGASYSSDASMRNPLVSLFQEKVEAYKKRKSVEVMSALGGERSSTAAGGRGVEGPSCVSDGPKEEEAKENPEDVDEDWSSCPEPAPLPENIFPQALSSAQADATAARDNESPGASKPRSPLQVRQQSAVGGLGGGHSVSDDLRRQVEDLTIQVRSQKDQLHCFQNTNAVLKKRLAESEGVVKDFATKYSHLLKEMIVAKDLMTHVNSFLERRLGVEDTVKRLNQTESQEVSHSHPMQTIEDLQRYPSEEIATGFSLAVERVAATLKDFKVSRGRGF